MQNRIRKIIENLPQNTAALVTGAAARRYLTGFSSSAGVVVVTPSGGFFFTDFRYIEKAQKTVKSCTVVESKKTAEQVGELLKNLGVKNLLVETRNLTLSDLSNWQTKLPEIEISKEDTLDQQLMRMRAVKEEAELQNIRAAQSITDAAFSHILTVIKEGKTEREIALELEFFLRKNGSEGVAFDTIAVSGKNSSLPHGVPTEKPLQKGDFLTMDFGAVVNGYCSDMTRTVAIGAVDEEQKRVYETVLEAQTAAFEVLRADVSGKAVDRAARDVIAAAGYGEAFGHSLGHSVGLEIHESPVASPSTEERLCEGTVITVEPGIYLPERFGVRIEDMVFVTREGYENLTQSPKELIIL